MCFVDVEDLFVCCYDFGCQQIIGGQVVFVELFFFVIGCYVFDFDCGVGSGWNN